jgi:Predicted membrane protein (DUF2254)/Cupin domain
MEHGTKRPTAKGPSDWFTGGVYIDSVGEGHGASPAMVAFVHFTPGARTAWHCHSLGQSLYVTEGEGRIQARGEPIVTLRPGDVVVAFATGLITVMGFIIAVVIAGLTFSSTSVTPRIVREMQRNTTIRHVSGLLLLSVVYAFLVLNRVAPPDQPNYVPDLAVWLITPLLVLDVAGLMVLVREMGHALRLVEIIDRVHHRAER